MTKSHQQKNYDTSQVHIINPHISNKVKENPIPVQRQVQTTSHYLPRSSNQTKGISWSHNLNSSHKNPVNQTIQTISYGQTIYQSDANQKPLNILCQG